MSAPRLKKRASAHGVRYAVGVDIACRMKLNVYDRKANTLAGQRDRLANIIEDETRFGMGCSFKERREPFRRAALAQGPEPVEGHDVMDENWSVSPVANCPRDKARSQVGTRGGGRLRNALRVGPRAAKSRSGSALPNVRRSSAAAWTRTANSPEWRGHGNGDKGMRKQFLCLHSRVSSLRSPRFL